VAFFGGASVLPPKEGPSPSALLLTSHVVSGVRPSPGATTLGRELVIEPSTTLDKAQLAVAEDGHTPL